MAFWIIIGITGLLLVLSLLEPEFRIGAFLFLFAGQFLLALVATAFLAKPVTLDATVVREGKYDTELLLPDGSVLNIDLEDAECEPDGIYVKGHKYPSWAYGEVTHHEYAIRCSAPLTDIDQ